MNESERIFVFSIIRNSMKENRGLLRSDLCSLVEKLCLDYKSDLEILNLVDNLIQYTQSKIYYFQRRQTSYKILEYTEIQLRINKLFRYYLKERNLKKRN